ncbi:MAG: pyruvate ferredoxin oxidoreductase [Candidatus Methanofastidiosia archaeon]
MRKVITGNYAVSYGVRDSRVSVIAAYPITPQTQIVELLSEFVANGELDAEFIKVESEHSAMAACIGASITGVRTFTATSSQGLALMHEMLHWAVGARTPVVIANVNRAMGPPWSIWTEQNDSLAQKETGLLQFYCSSNQEVYDTIIQSFKVSEEVQLPAMIVLDAFILSHTYEPVDIISISHVDEFLPPYNPRYTLDTEDPHAFGGLGTPEIYMELRYNIHEDHLKALELIRRYGREFGEMFSRTYDVFEEYRCEDAEILIVMAGSAASTAKDAVDVMRERGLKIGLLRMRVLRPFPKDDLRKVSNNKNLIVVIDRNISFGNEGIFFTEVKSCLYGSGVPIQGYVAGLGGRDILTEDIVKMTEEALQTKQVDFKWWGVKL